MQARSNVRFPPIPDVSGFADPGRSSTTIPNVLGARGTVIAGRCLYDTPQAGPERALVPPPQNASESQMYRLGEETHETTTEARASVNVKGMTMVLGGGLVLTILAFVVIAAFV